MRTSALGLKTTFRSAVSPGKWHSLARHVDRLKLSAIETFVAKVKAAVPDQSAEDPWLVAINVELEARRAEVPAEVVQPPSPAAPEAAPAES